MKNIVLSLILLILLISPLVINSFTGKTGEYVGSDNKGTELIGEIRPEYDPWFSFSVIPLPPVAENLLFTLQAAIGTGVLFFTIGYYKGRKQASVGMK